MIGEVTHLGGLSGLSGRVTLSAGEAICQVDVSRVTRLVEVAFMLLLRERHPGLWDVCERGLFSTTAMWVTWPTWGPDPHVSFFFLCRLSLSLVGENPDLLLENFMTLLPRYFLSAEYHIFGSKPLLPSSRLKWASIQNVCSSSGLSCLVLSHALA